MPPAWNYTSSNTDFGNLTSNCYENGDAVVRLLFGEARSHVLRIRVSTSPAGVVCGYSEEGTSSDGARARHGQARDTGYWQAVVVAVRVGGVSARLCS